MTVTVVAELGVNHNGDLGTALQMVDAAAEAGCDAVKVQAYRCEDFLPRDHPDWDTFRKSQLHWTQILRISSEARKHGLKFGATPTNEWGIRVLELAGVDFLKNGSDFLLRHDIIEAMGRTGIPTVLGTGMAELDEVRAAIRAFRKGGGSQLTCLVCTSSYPCPDAETNLLRLANPTWTLYDTQVGFSDHTKGNVAATAAVALGATMIEKHFTLDKTQPGPDHWFSADPGEMAWLVHDVRRVERMLGSSAIEPTAGEFMNRDLWRVTQGTLRTA